MLPGAIAVSATETAPAVPGAYALLIRIDEPLDLTLRPGAHRFVPGWYVYAGSANGPGGLRARLARHMRADKKPHWHVDRLTQAAARIEALALEGGSECAIVAALTYSGPFAHVLDRFGSSDCRACRSHLLMWAGQD